jgi:hypothetical protein
MRKKTMLFLMIAAFALAIAPAACKAGDSGDDNGSTGDDGSKGASSLPSNAKVIYLHHSTGGVVWGGGVSDLLSDYDTKGGKSYSIIELAYPDSPYPWQNYPYDYWHLWVQGGGQATAESVPTLETFASEYNVIVFKHCFPVSGIEADTGSPDITSQDKTIENYKLQYNAIKKRLHDFPNNRFIVWTGAAELGTPSNNANGARARQFFQWVKNDWDEKGDNIYVWDFYELETEGGDFLLPAYSADAVGGDSHPSAAFAATVAPLFVKRLTDVIDGRGDSGSLTGK